MSNLIPYLVCLPGRSKRLHFLPRNRFETFTKCFSNISLFLEKLIEHAVRFNNRLTPLRWIVSIYKINDTLPFFISFTASMLSFSNRFMETLMLCLVYLMQSNNCIHNTKKKKGGKKK